MRLIVLTAYVEIMAYFMWDPAYPALMGKNRLQWMVIVNGGYVLLCAALVIAVAFMKLVKNLFKFSWPRSGMRLGDFNPVAGARLLWGDLIGWFAHQKNSSRG